MTKSREKYGSYLLSRYKTFDFIESMKNSKNYGLLGFIGEYFGLRWSFALAFPFLMISLLSISALNTNKNKNF